MAGEKIGRFLPRTISGRLFLLLFVVFVPATLLETAVHYVRFTERRAQEFQANLEVARSVAATFEAYLQDVLRQESTIGVILASSENGPYGRTDELLARAARQYSSIRVVGWVNLQGRVIASSNPAHVGTDISDLSYFQQILQGQEWAVSDLFQTRVGGEPSFAIARGISVNGNTLQGVVVALVDPERLGSVLQVERPKQGAISIMDRQGRGVYRYPEAEMSWEQRDWVAVSPNIRPALAGQETTGTFVSVFDGQVRMAGNVPIRSIGWVAGANRPEAEALAPVVQDRLRQFGLYLLAAATALAIALIIARSFVAPVGYLREYALAVGRGELGHRVKVSGPSEVQEVASALNQMAEEILLREAELRKSEERYRNLVELTTDIIYITDLEGNNTFMNGAGLRALEAPREEVVGKPWLNWIHPDDRDRTLKTYLQMVEQGTEVFDFENRHLAKSGRTIPVLHNVRVLRNDKEEIVAFQGIARDITRRKRMEQERERLLAELDATVSSLADGLIVYGPTMEIIRMNAAAERMTEYSRLDREKPLAERLAALHVEGPDGKPLSIEDIPPVKALRGETVLGAVGKLRLHAAREVWISASAAPIRAADGRVLGAVLSLTDITPQQELLEQRDDLMRTISHDLRNPLTSIMGVADWLRRTLDQNGLVREAHMAESLLTSARRMNTMIQDLVESARLESGRLEMRKEPTDIFQLVSDIAERIEGPGDHARIRVECPERVPAALVDGERIERAIVNLVTNALKYSSADTSVTVRVGRSEDGAIISVTDQGVGIPAEEIPYLFERFYRARTGKKAEGLGLGLYIVRLIVEAHGGRVWVESAVGQASTFYLTLPLA